MKPTTRKNIALINKTVEALQETFLNLYCRWQDERDHENIQDYADAITAKMPFGMNFVKMKKRPFSYHFELDGVTYSIYAKSTAYGWERISY